MGTKNVRENLDIPSYDSINHIHDCFALVLVITLCKAMAIAIRHTDQDVCWQWSPTLCRTSSSCHSCCSFPHTLLLLATVLTIPVQLQQHHLFYGLLGQPG